MNASDLTTIGCASCGSPLGAVRYFFALQHHHVVYPRSGRTPSEQAALKPSAINTLARYCSHSCCDLHLPQQMELLGLSPHLQHYRVHGGPICSCGQCGKPVDMTTSHVAVIAGEVHLKQDDMEHAPQWFDMYTVLCPGCTGIQGGIVAALGDASKRALESRN